MEKRFSEFPIQKQKQKRNDWKNKQQKIYQIGKRIIQQTLHISVDFNKYAPRELRGAFIGCKVK